MKNYVSNQTGRSMIEMLGVLAIVGVLSVAGIAGYSKAMAKYKTNKIIDQFSTVAANVRTIFAGQGDYKGLTGTVAYQLGIYPEEMSKDCTDKSCTAKTALGGDFYVAQDFYNHDVNSFYLGASNLSKDACSALVAADWGSASNVKAFATVTKPVDMRNYADVKNNQISVAAELCSCSSAKNDCSLMIYFK